jgi:hypothetical protein
MGKIDSGSKSNRLLASRRYTHNTLNTSQEAFTNVLDLRSEEIYTRAHLIPSSSLPHSGSSQKNAIFTKNGQNVTKYWYRHCLTKSNVNNEVFFFLSPTGSSDGIGPQLIDDNQQTNFISPKYSVSSLANATTEDATPGYLAIVYKSTTTNTASLGGGDIVSTNDYQFDYKTGVLQFKSDSVDPSDSQKLYMTVYQYVGQNLRTGLEVQGPFTASNVTFTGESDITSFGSTAQSMISGSWRGELSSSSVTAAGGGISGSSSSTGSFGQVFVGDRLVFKDHQDSGEYIESDGTDLSINVGANGDINIPANIGMTFGNDGEKIEGDGTNLTLAGGDINLTAEADVNIPADIGLTFGDDGEKIEGDGTDLTINSSNDLNLTATTDINIPANVGLTFGNDGEKIEGDGTDMTIASSGVLTLSSGGNTLVETVTFNNGDVTIPGDLTVTGNRIEAQVGSLQVADHTITVGSGSATSALMEAGGIDWGVSGSIANLRYQHATTSLTSSVFLAAPKLTVDTITLDAAEIDASGALTIDAGADITLDATGDVNVPANIGMTFGNDGEKIEGDGTDLTIASSNDLHLTATTDINIPSNVGLTFGNDGEKIEGDGTDLTIASSAKLKLDVATDLEIDVDGGDITVTDDGAHIVDISATKISGSATSTGSFGYIKAQSGISSSGQVDINSSFAQLRLTDDGMNDYLRIGQSGTVGYIKTSDADNNFKFRRGSDNTDLVEIFFEDERFHISGSGGLDVTGNVTASGDVSASGDVRATNFYGQVATAAQTNITSLLATDIKIGEDDQTKIDFGTTNEIRFAADNQVQLKIADGVLAPLSDSDVDLGTSGQYFKDAYIDSIVTTGNISGSSVSTGSFAYVDVSSKVSGSATSTGSFGKLEIGSGVVTTTGNMTLDADGAQIRLEDGGTEFGRFSRVASDFVIKSMTGDKDLLFKGVDDTTTITALKLDMSEGGDAEFSGNVSGSSASTGSFGKVLGDGSDLTGVTDDSALAFSIVFGG